jgi:hypothetical protein
MLVLQRFSTCNMRRRLFAWIYAGALWCCTERLRTRIDVLVFCVLGELWRHTNLCTKVRAPHTRAPVRFVSRAFDSSRSVASPATCGGSCSPNQYSQACNGCCPVDCQVGQWGGFSACSGAVSVYLGDAVSASHVPCVVCVQLAILAIAKCDC